MNKEVMKRRLEELGEPAALAISRALEKEKVFNCRSCKEPNIVSVSDSVTVRAALGVMDRIGLGPTAKLEHAKAEPEGLEALLEDLCALPYGQRVSIAVAMLPEHKEQLAGFGLKRISSVTESPVDAIVSPRSS